MPLAMASISAGKGTSECRTISAIEASGASMPASAIAVSMPSTEVTAARM
jgi:hypothetical protein